MFVLVLAWCLVGGGCRDEVVSMTFPSMDACWMEAQKRVRSPLLNDRGEELIGARCIDKDTYEDKE